MSLEVPQNLNSSLLLHDQLEHLRLKLSIQLHSHHVQFRLCNLLDLPPPLPLLGSPSTPGMLVSGSGKAEPQSSGCAAGCCDWQVGDGVEGKIGEGITALFLAEDNPPSPC